MTINVKVPTQLRALTQGSAEVSAEGLTVRALIQDLEVRYPGIGSRLLDDEGSLRRFVNVYVNDEDVRFLKGLETDLSEESRVSIIPAVAGG